MLPAIVWDAGNGFIGACGVGGLSLVQGKIDAAFVVCDVSGCCGGSIGRIIAPVHVVLSVRPAELGRAYTIRGF